MYSYLFFTFLLSFSSLLFVSPAVDSASTNSKKDPPVYQLPSYIKKACSRNDPDINNCVVEVGAPAIKSVVRGDPKYRIPQLDPLHIKEIRVKQGTKQVGLELVCEDCLLWGLQNTVFTKADVNWKDRTCKWDFTLDKLNVTGKYNVTGQVLLLPIVGSGNAQFNLEDMKFSYIYDWSYEKKKNGYTYVIIGNSTFPFEVGKMTLKLENLFNGDPLLGGNMNRFLNEHWQEILKDLKPALSNALASLATTTLTNMARVVPFDIMFPDI